MRFKLFRRKEKFQSRCNIALVGYAESKFNHLLTTKTTNHKADVQLLPPELVTVSRFRARHNNFDFSLTRLVDGARCSTGEVWKNYLLEKQMDAYVCLIGGMYYEGFSDFYRMKSKLPSVLDDDDKPKIVLFLIDDSAPRQEDDFRREIQEFVEEIKKKHRVASFVFKDGDESVDAAFDWLVDEIAKDEAEKMPLSNDTNEKKTESTGANWIAALAKKVLLFGAVPHQA